MRRNLLLAVLAFASWGICLPASAAFTRCMHISGTADAVIKSNAVERSVQSLRDAIDKWKAENGVTGPVTEIAEKPRPVPYWRSEVSPGLFLPPDVVTDASYTLCWKGVVSPVVCTSGTKLCW
jgi:hypothetical protein